MAGIGRNAGSNLTLRNSGILEKNGELKAAKIRVVDGSTYILQQEYIDHMYKYFIVDLNEQKIVPTAVQDWLSDEDIQRIILRTSGATGSATDS